MLESEPVTEKYCRRKNLHLMIGTILESQVLQEQY